MKKMSQSELYSLSRYFPDAFTPENNIVPSSNSENRPTTHRRIFAFSHRRRVSISDGDSQVTETENRLILNSLKKLVADGEVYDSNARGVEKRKRKRKRKLKSESEFEGLGVVNVNGGEFIDLKVLARDGDDVFELELNRMTVGMVREEEFLGFLNGLEGRWGSTRKRRKYVDAILFVKLLPLGWKILLSLRPRVRRPSLYCRRFVSPSGEHFKSCKEVAFYLKSQFAANNANPPEVDLESGRVHRSSHPASKIDFSGTNNNLIKCNIGGDSFTSIVVLELHMQKYHGDNNERLDEDTLSRKHSVPHGLLLVREPKYPPPIIKNSTKQIKVVENKDTVTRCNESKNIPTNGEGSSSEWKDLKTRCVWCLVEFFHEPVDSETLASSSGFICPKCKEDVSWRFESDLSRLTQRDDKC